VNAGVTIPAVSGRGGGARGAGVFECYLFTTIEITAIEKS